MSAEYRPSILVVEDEESIRRGICDVLAFRGYEPIGVGHGEEGLREALSGRHALLVLDVMLPGMDGFTICRKVREQKPRQAILMLTARGAEDDVLEGFRAGADDYVPKPFSVAQLMARIQALLRRALAEAQETLLIAGVEVDARTLEARRDGHVAELSPRDVEVLGFLAREAPRVVGRTELLREVWGYARAEALETRCVDMHVAKLRKKLAPLCGGDAEAVVETVRGAGYRVPISTGAPR
jgi:two-component system response regulator RegX3